MRNFHVQGVKCLEYLRQVITALENVIRHSIFAARNQYIEALASLIMIVKQHIKPHLQTIFTLIKELWHAEPALQPSLLAVIESISRSLQGEFKAHLPMLLPLLLSNLDGDAFGWSKPVIVRILKSFCIFNVNMEEYNHLILPAIIRCFERPEAPADLRKTAIICVGHLARRVNFDDHASRLIHPLTRVLATGSSELRTAVLDTIMALAIHLGFGFQVFIPMIEKVSHCLLFLSLIDVWYSA